MDEKEIETDKIEKKKKVGTIFSTHKTIKNVGINDFKVIKVIGRGSYGKVCLVEFEQTKELFAMKSLKKILISFLITLLTFFSSILIITVFNYYDLINYKTINILKILLVKLLKNLIPMVD